MTALALRLPAVEVSMTSQASMPKGFPPAALDAPDAQWRVVHTKVCAERQAYVHLLEQGFGAFYPHVRRHMRLRGRIVTLRQAYFSRYLFVGVYGRLSCYAVNSTPGVATILKRMDGSPLDVPRYVVTDLAAQADAYGMMPAKLPPPKQLFSPGDVVRVKRGLFESYTGTVERADGPILAAWIGGRLVTMTADMVELLAAAQRQAA